MPRGSSGLLQNTGNSKGAFHRLTKGTLLNYCELTDCNTALRSPSEPGSLASALRSSRPFHGDRQTDRQLRIRGSAGSTASTPQLLFYCENNISELGGSGGAENLATT